jgi:signal transduction histidine kinase
VRGQVKRKVRAVQKLRVAGGRRRARMVERMPAKLPGSSGSDERPPVWGPHDVLDRERRVAMGMTAAAVVAGLGNPLNVLAMHAELVARRLARLGPVDERVAESLATMGGEVRRLARLFEGFRAMERRAHVAPIPADVPAVIASVLDAVADRIREVGVAVELELAVASPADVVDPERVAQMLGHLVDNAIDAMPAGGTLALRSRGDASRLEIEVADTGPGLPDEIDPFAAFVGTTPARDGLGLFFAHRIASLHGGSLAHRRDAGETIFTLALPRRRASASAQP